MKAPPPAGLVAAVALGGAVGAVLRWSLTEVFPTGDGFPWTVLAINVVGSLVLAALPALGAVRRHRVVAVGLGPGVLGGFTTLSASSEDARALLADGRPPVAAAYVLGTLAACLVAVAVAGRWSDGIQQRPLADEEGDG